MTPEEQIAKLKDVIGLLIKDDDKGENDAASSAALHDVIAAKARERINPPTAAEPATTPVVTTEPAEGTTTDETAA